MTSVYNPGRSAKLKEVPLKHTMQLGQRYKHHFNGGKLKPRYIIDKWTLNRYIKYLETKDSVKQDEGKVIAYSLYSGEVSAVRGLLRNVQQAPVYFPGWTVRIYIHNNNIPLPQRLLNKMKTLGAKVIPVDEIYYSNTSVYVHALLDESVDTVLLRDPHFRFSDRQKSAVDEWMTSHNTTMHCMRDHPSHAAMSLVPGLLGIKLSHLRKNKKTRFDSLLQLLTTNTNTSFESELWRQFQDDFMCHDSVSCSNWPNSKAFPAKINEAIPAYEGQRYTENMTPYIAYNSSLLAQKCPDRTTR